MILDAALSFFHFVFLLIMVAALGGQAYLLRAAPNAENVPHLARADWLYRLSATLLIVVGMSRVSFGATDDDYYFASQAFWAKMVLVATIALISTWPTKTFINWSRALKADAAFLPPENEFKRARLLVRVEMHLLALVVLFAVIMARWA